MTFIPTHADTAPSLAPSASPPQTAPVAAANPKSALSASTRSPGVVAPSAADAYSAEATVAQATLEVRADMPKTERVASMTSAEGTLPVDSDIRNARVYLLDDEPANVILLKRMLRGVGYTHLESATDSRQGMRECIDNPPDLLMLDLMMPHVDGYEVMETLRAVWGPDNPIPILVLTADASRQACHRALSLGASDFVNKPIDMMEMRLRAHNLLHSRLLDQRLRGANAQLEERISQRTRDLERINLDLQEAQAEALEKLAQAAEFRDDDTGDHIRRVGNCAELLARQLGLSVSEARLVGRAAPLHDIGKIAISDAILLKPGRLTAEEFEVMKTHASMGAALLSHSRSPLMQRAETIALTHHERFDGSGYPAGMVGEEIPLEGRIAAVIDVFDALTHERPYKQAWTTEAALAEIVKCSGSHFDPRVVAAFCQLRHEDLI